MNRFDLALKEYKPLHRSKILEDQITRGIDMWAVYFILSMFSLSLFFFF